MVVRCSHSDVRSVVVCSRVEVADKGAAEVVCLLSERRLADDGCEEGV